MSEEFEEIEIVKFTKKKPKKSAAKTQPLITAQKKAEDVSVNHQVRYLQLLKRITSTLHKNNPDLGEKAKITLQPPQVERVGKKKTTIVNFVQLCKNLDRHPEHVMNFFLLDLGALGSIGSLGFVIKNVLQQKQVEEILRKYIIEFVQCQICKRQNTILTKDEKMKLWRLQCKNCKCSRTVPTIKGGEKKFEDWEKDQTVDS